MKQNHLIRCLKCDEFSCISLLDSFRSRFVEKQTRNVFRWQRQMFWITLINNKSWWKICLVLFCFRFFFLVSLFFSSTAVWIFGCAIIIGAYFNCFISFYSFHFCCCYCFFSWLDMCYVWHGFGFSGMLAHIQTRALKFSYFNLIQCLTYFVHRFLVYRMMIFSELIGWVGWVVDWVGGRS